MIFYFLPNNQVYSINVLILLLLQLWILLRARLMIASLILERLGSFQSFYTNSFALDL